MVNSKRFLPWPGGIPPWMPIIILRDPPETPIPSPEEYEEAERELFEYLHRYAEKNRHRILTWVDEADGDITKATRKMICDMLYDDEHPTAKPLIITAGVVAVAGWSFAAGVIVGVVLSDDDDDDDDD